MSPIDAEVLATLRASRVEGARVVLPPRQLPRSLYERTDRVLRDLGGRWCSSAQAHVFERDPSEGLARVLEGRDALRDLGWFATPPSLARSLVARARVRRGDRALAPAAGEGAIVEELLRAGARVTAVELDPWRVERLRSRFPEATVIEGDVLTMQPRDLGVFGAVVTCPPWRTWGLRGADAAHLAHALELVRYCGSVVAVVSAEAARGEARCAPRLRDELDALGAAVEPLEGEAIGVDGPAVIVTLREVGRC